MIGMRHINVPDLLDVPAGTEIAWWVEYKAFADSLTAVERHSNEVQWQTITGVKDDDTHIIVTTDGGESAIDKRFGVVVREPAGPVNPLLTRVLDDVLNRRVSITAGNVIVLADDTQVEPSEHEDYITTVLVLRDAAWVMPERRPNPRGDDWLRLTTVGDQMRIRGVEAVTV